MSTTLLGSYVEVSLRMNILVKRDPLRPTLRIDVRGLNLAKNLLADWDIVQSIIQHLLGLRDLNLESVCSLAT